MSLISRDKYHLQLVRPQHLRVFLPNSADN